MFAKTVALLSKMNNNRKLKAIISKDIFQQEEVQQFSFSLSGKMAMNTAITTPYGIAEKLNELLRDE